MIVYVDVDDTLVRSASSKRIPMTGVIAKIKVLKSQGNELYLWSSGGAEYARAAANEVGIADCFEGFLPKPNLYIDDQPVQEWRNCVHRYPSQSFNLE